MALEELEALDSLLTQASERGWTPEKQLAFVDSWRDDAMTDAESYFKPEDYVKHQAFVKSVDDDVIAAKDPLLKSVTENTIRNHYGDDVNEANRFVKELNEKQDNFPAYEDSTHATLAKQITNNYLAANRPAPTQPVQSALRDQKGNTLVDASIAYNENGSATYARLMFSGQLSDASETDDLSSFVPGLTANQKIGPNKGGDVIRFPKGFNGVKYLQNKKDQEIAKIAELARAEERSLIEPDRQVANYGADLDRLKKERDLITNPVGVDVIKRLEHEGANAYLQDAIRKKVEAGDPRYKDVGRGILEGSWQNVENTLTHMWQSARAGAANTALLVESELVKTGDDLFGKYNPFTTDTPIKKHLEDVIEDVGAANKLQGQLPTFSRLAITQPELAKTLDEVSGAVSQGTAIAAQFALLGPTAGFASAYLQGAGGKVVELTEKANELRGKGDAESIRLANWIDANKYMMANRSGLYETVAEKLFAGHDPTRPFRKTGLRAALGEFAVSAPQEGVEGMFSGTSNAIDNYLSGITSFDGFMAEMSDVPKQGLLEAAGVLVPGGARAIVSSMMGRSGASAVSGIPPNTSVNPPTISPQPTNGKPTVIQTPAQTQAQVANNAADRAQATVVAARSVTETIDGTSGDQGAIVVGEPKGKKPKTHKDTRNYLTSVYNRASKYISELAEELGIENISIPLIRNVQEQELDPDASVLRVISGNKEDVIQREINVSREIQRKIMESEEYQAMTPEDQKKALDKAIFTLDPRLSNMRRMGIAVGDGAGRTAMVTSADLVKAIEKGEINPNTHYFYKDYSVPSDGSDPDYQALLQAVPEDRWVGGRIGLGTKIKRTPEGPVRTQSKANEQVVISGTKSGLKTATIGGRTLFKKDPMASLEDELADPELTTEQGERAVQTWDEETGGTKTVNVKGRFLSPAGQTKLIQNLDKKYGRNNWVLKRDAELKSIGVIFPWVKGNLIENRTKFAQPIPIHEDYMYLAQERVRNPKAEYRVHIRANNDGTLNIVPLGIFGGKLNLRRTLMTPMGDFNDENVPDEESQSQAAFGSFPLTAVPKTVRDKLVDLVKDLEGTEIAEHTDTVYGVDVVVDENDNYKIVELNPEDEEGSSGMLAGYTSVTNGVISMMRQGYSAEAMAVYAAYQRLIGNEQISAKLLEDAIERLNGTLQDIPDAEALYHQGTFFSNPISVTENKEADSRVITSFFNQFGSEGTVEDLLEHIGRTSEEISPDFKNLAAALMGAARYSNNRGRNAKVVSTSGRSNYTNGVVHTNKTVRDAIHEAMHALSIELLPEEIINSKLTGDEYVKFLQNYLNKNNVEPLLRNIIEDYVEAYSKVKGDEYGLTSLPEFIAEALTNQSLADKLDTIPNEVSRSYMRKLLNSIMEWVKSRILLKGDPAKTLFDRTHNDIMMFIASDDVPQNRWESAALSRNPYSTVESNQIQPGQEVKFFANPLQSTEVVEGEEINTDHLTAAEKAELIEMQNAKPQRPSRDRKETAVRLRKKAEEREFQLLKEAFPQAFDSNTNFTLAEDGKTKVPVFKGFTTLQNAEMVLIDYLVDNPKEVKGDSLLSPTGNAKATQRLKLVKQTTSYYKTVKKKINNKTFKGYEALPPDIQTQVVRVIDWILNGGNPKDLTNRQLTANNLALKNFIKSDGANIRGFAAIAQQLYVGQENSKLSDLKSNLLAQGVNKPWGAPIDDWRRNLSGKYKTKTGSSLADWTTEMLAIFNRPESRKVFSAMMAPFMTGIHKYKSLLSDFRDDYNQRLKDLKPTTKLQDVRIGMAAMLTQFDQAGDPLAQITDFVNQVNESISRKEGIPGVLQGSDIKFGQLRKDAPIEREAWNELIGPIFADIQAGTIAYDDIIDHIETTLNKQENDILKLIREPGQKYYRHLDAINQMARGDGLEDWMNYFKRVQIDMNGESMTRHWGADAIQSADSILQPREGLAKGNVFILDFRPAFQWQLNETAYELNTGVDRVMLFQLLKDPTFAKIMDENDPSTPRTQRMQAQIGGVHSNIKNPEIQFGIVAGLTLEAMRLFIIKDLVNGKAFANQLIPFFNIFFNNPSTSSDVAFNMLFRPSHRRNTNEWLKKNVPDLFNRLRGWDSIVEGFQGREKHKDSGMTRNILNKNFERLVTGANRAAHVLKSAWTSPWIGQIGLTLTNGISEVFSAKNVFMTLYISKLIKKGTVTDTQDFFNQPNLPYDAQALTEAQIEFDAYVLMPISSEYRSEMSQRNSGSKILINLSTNALGRTGVQQSLKSVTALRDLFSASVEMTSSKGRNAANKAFIQESALQVTRQMMNIALYHGIRTLYQLGLGGIATAAWFVAESKLAGEPEDEEYWRRRLRNLEKLNKDRQASYAKEQMMVDGTFFGVPFPGFIQNNIGRELMNQIYRHARLDNRTGKDFEDDLAIQRRQRDKKKETLAAAVLSGTMPPKEIHDLNEALEVIEYGIALNEKLRDEKVEYFERAMKGMTQAASSLTEVATDKELYKARMWMPDYAEDIIFADKEKVDAQKKEMDDVSNNSAWHALSAHFNMFAPTTKAADQTLKEFATKKLADKKALEQLKESLVPMTPR